MKMVLVFDTDDHDGCRSSLKIMKQLARDYNFEGVMSNHDDPKFGKIEFIKMIKDFDAYCMLPNTDRNSDGGSVKLRALKEFADQVWEQKQLFGYYKPKWTRR